MTVGFLYKMQRNHNSIDKLSSSKRQKSKHQKVLEKRESGNNTTSDLTKCVPLKVSEDPCSGADVPKTPLTQNKSNATSLFKQECLSPEPPVSSTDAEHGRCSPELLVCAGICFNHSEESEQCTISGPPVPPPSLASANSSDQTTDQNKMSMVTPESLPILCVPINNRMQISENVPVPTKTDIIARVSREAICQDNTSLKDEDSDAFASGEELDLDKRSEYSTADEGDCEVQYKRKVEVLAATADEDINSEDSNSNSNLSDSARTTNANFSRHPCSPVFARLAANSEALKPVLVKQVSEDEEVRVVSDDDEVCSPVLRSCDTELSDRNEPCDSSNEPITVGSAEVAASSTRCIKMESTDATSTGPTNEQVRSDCRTQPVQWSEKEICKPIVILEEPSAMCPNTQEPQKDASEPLRWKSMPTLPVAKPLESDRPAYASRASREVFLASPRYPTSRSVGEASNLLLATHAQQSSNLQQITEEVRVRRAITEAMNLCEEELGPVALALSHLQEKVRRLNIPELRAQCRTVQGLTNSYLLPAPSVNSIVRKNNKGTPELSPGLTAISSNATQNSTTQLGPVAQIAHQSECVCTYCGLQVGNEANLSPVARMYVLLAQPHRSSNQNEDGGR